LRALGLLTFMLPRVAILLPPEPPRGQERTLEQKALPQELPSRRRRLTHVHSRIKRCRLGTDRSRLWQEGVRDLVLDLGCALSNFRVRLPPWSPRVASGYTQTKPRERCGRIHEPSGIS
jgi:hypothetical protein